MEISENDFIFSDDKRRIDVKMVHSYLAYESYWAKNISISLVQKSIDHSLCFGIYRKQEQIGFARWITDEATFGYLCDVFVLPAFRGMGLSKKLLSFMMLHPALQRLRRYQLVTRDAHDLYKRFGFKTIAHPEQQMAIVMEKPYIETPDDEI